MLKTRIILSEVTNLSDARYASGMGVDYISFSLDPANDSFMPNEKIKEIYNWLAGIELVGDIGSKIPEDFNTEIFSFHQTSNPELVSLLRNPILSFDLQYNNLEEVEELMKEYSGKVSFFVLIIPIINLSGNIESLNKLCGTYPIFLSADFNEHNVIQVLNEINPEGIVLYGSKEEEPGLSSYEGIADILELLEEN